MKKLFYILHLLTFASILSLTSCKESLKPEICYDIYKKRDDGKMVIRIRSADKFLTTAVTYIQFGNKKIYQGDIILEDNFIYNGNESKFYYDSNSKVYKSLSTYGNLWDQSIIYYEFDGKLSRSQKKKIEEAIQYWEDETNLTFIKDSTKSNWVFFIYSKYGPASDAIGMKGGRQHVHISSETSLGNIKHEIGHVAGLWHEQSRADRGKYIFIDKSNILKKFHSQFDIQPGNINSQYDYASIMHYPSNAFATNPKKPTIKPLPFGSTQTIGQRDRLSKLDIIGLGKIYPDPENRLAYSNKNKER